jgi:hypothetical protein
VPFLADIDNPPASRGRDLLLGLVVAVPVVGGLFGWLIPTFAGAILAGANNLDDTLRQQDQYMQRVCGMPELPRDEALCACVFAVEFPALDCQDQFRPWLAARAGEQCVDPTTQRDRTSFCVCAEVVAQDMAAATAADDPASARNAGQGMDRCLALPDALPLEDVYRPAVSP